MNKNINKTLKKYRKISLSVTGDTLKKTDGTLLITAHWV